MHDRKTYLVACFLNAKILNALKPSLQSYLTTNLQQQLLTNTGHGCWCNSDENWNDLSGPTQDILDEYCKNLILGYKCIKRDFGRKVCDPSTVNYEFQIEFLKEEEKRDRIFCKERNK